VPASQTVGGVPPGWCAQNSKGTVDCKSEGEFGTWSGQCRGAQPPYRDDVCAPGDFNCDGKEFNPASKDCSCQLAPVQCPTAALTTAPYPPPGALPLKVDATSWFTYAADVASATNWRWTMSGGDCDNILPHPTFSMYPTGNGTGTGVGGQINTLGASGKEHGLVATTLGLSFYPAFSVSGDYLVQGEFDLKGTHYTCQQKIQVRAPGIRAEACWDTVTDGDDLDLHMAKVNGFASCTHNGWVQECKNEDCYYGTCVDAITNAPDWYAASASGSCQGWGSQTTGSCRNPRLDRDANGVSGTCEPSVTNPNKSGFCGPENINVDAPANGSQYAVGVKFFDGTDASKTHVNIYCNGERILSSGYNPVTGNDYPQLKDSGLDHGGDFWKVALVTAQVNGGVLSCTVTPVSSTNAHTGTDGSSSYCVDNQSSDGTTSTEYLTKSGGTPANANALCFH
jgi:hypothetical protein